MMIDQEGFRKGETGMEAVAGRSNVWNNILQTVEKRINRQTFDSWFRPIQFEGIDETSKVIYLKTNQVNKDWVEHYYSNLIKQIMHEMNLPNYEIEWKIEEENPYENEEFFSDQGSSNEKSYIEICDSPVTTTSFIDIEPADTTLNPKYTFETFVVGKCNEFAHAASLRVAESPGKTYNPLFIYGGVGLGKTHLMHAVGHFIKEKNRHMRVAYISAEKFMNELINAIRYDKTQVFREKYRSIDVLLIDDIQFMAGKERTQEEFFHTFNTLHNNQKQIVITSDCPPREIPALEERLHSRFEWGLIADIEPPELETKIAILKRKAELENVEIPDDVAFYIASKVKSNVRELEGALIRLIAISSLKGAPITKALAQDAIRNVVGFEESENISIEKITKIVASHYKLTVEDLKSKNNSRHIAFPRQVAMYLCKKLTKSSFPEIGRAFGGKHHTTVIHSVEKIENLIKEDRNFHKVINDLIDCICK
ncbi:MAG: chromosomal replication initiator protein DnaA [Pyrinomonadaceae bacterium]|nr:chromosomal replication initiator protein DnaA [Pyrinomonadaceae bacterium]MCX7639124.1 chromosomal replication initiator protein DnaA [Pyrinomonadaceae bacterium]MDW8303655.1 chromosomal replication initiator protein DnaA [Acidobacteriota bacterium]